MSLLEIFVTELLLGQPRVSLRVDGVEALVELKGGPECLQEKSQLAEFQKLLSVLALTLEQGHKGQMISLPPLIHTGDEFLANLKASNIAFLASNTSSNPRT